ncbi:MAG TPA: Rv2175c family DNA-binding protein [Actinomycetes bacterium]|nr:Rv2175c family DNA-binding protein [Actinomycetes bacterium]
MSEAPTALVPSWLTLPDAAEALGTDVIRVRQAIRDRALLAFRVDGVLAVPAAFVQDGHVLKGLPGLLTVLHDAGFSDDDALRWAFTPDDSLPGTPIEALRANRGKEVRRRAQSLAW